MERALLDKLIITTPTKASTTTNKATTTDMRTASTRSHVVTTPTKASTTTNKATTTDMTTDMTTASSRSHGGLLEELTTGLMSALAIIAAVFFTVGGILGYRHLKYKGSYNTGEALRTKEEFLLNQSV